MSQTRRLAAILAADVAGYSRLIGADEGGTLRRLRAIRGELVDPTIAAHHGRLVKTTGDGLLVEFGSVVSSLLCATEIQAGMAERNATVPQDERIEFRMGLNVGDVVVEDGDIFGDGVNVAARLEALAEPGGICVSGRIQEDAAGKLDLTFEDIGEQQLKNITRPVRVYALRPKGAAALTSSSIQPSQPILRPAAAPRLSIVVLPFINLGNEPDQQYFADGITEDLTTDLSRLPGVFVISRNTAFTYRNKPVDTKQIGRDLAVRYVLEGSVRRSGNRLRVNAQLIDVETDAHLWAERFDRESGDLFAVQNEIATRIAVALNIELVFAEAVRPTDHPDALGYIFRARAALSKGFTRNNYSERIGYLERALELDPQSVEAKSQLASTLAGRTIDNMADDPAADLDRARKLSREALAASPRNPYAHYGRGQVLRAQGRCEEAIPHYEAAIAFNPNDVNAISQLAQCKFLTGSIEEAIDLAEQSIRLSPAIRACSIGFHGSG